jgi:hypothetical protein
MPFITSLGSPTSSLKTRPLANSQLKPGELISVPKGQALGVTFPFSDADKPVQAVRLVGNATNLGLKSGEVYYVFYKEWNVSGKPWELTKQGKPTVSKVGIWDQIVNGGIKQYKPKMEPGDLHLVVSDDESLPTSTMHCLDHNGAKLWTRKCLARGQSADWKVYAGDTPTGLYQLGQVWIADRGDVDTVMPYGIHCFDMISVEGGENSTGRAGICLHGGGSALGYPGCIADMQKLVPTFGCIRMHNAELRDLIYPMWKECDRAGKKIWVSVYQL